MTEEQQNNNLKKNKRIFKNILVLFCLISTTVGITIILSCFVCVIVTVIDYYCDVSESKVILIIIVSLVGLMVVIAFIDIIRLIVLMIYTIKRVED